MQTVNYSDYIYYAGTTQPVVRVPVYVYEANTENLASLYDGSGAAIDNPTQTDDNGLFDFWTTFGKYDIYVHNTKEYSVSLLNLAYFYLGVYDANPTERPDGSDLQDGDMYFNSVINHSKVYNNGLWYYADDMMNASGVAYDPASGPQTDVQTQMRAYDTHLDTIDTHLDVAVINTNIAITDDTNASDLGYDSINIVKGGSFTVASGKTLTIDVPFSAGAYQVFFGDGDVVLAEDANPVQLDIWWGGSGTAIRMGGVYETDTELISLHLKRTNGDGTKYPRGLNIDFTNTGSTSSTAFNANNRVSGANSLDHTVGVQIRNYMATTGSISIVYGSYNSNSISGSAVTGLYGYYVDTPSIGSGGSVSTSVAFYAKAQLGAVSIYGFYGEGGAGVMHYFGNYSGFGTANVPTCPVHIKRDGTTGPFIKIENSAGDTYSLYNGGAGLQGLYKEAGGPWLISWDASGSIGINETTPNYKLHVNGTFGFVPGSSVTPAENGELTFEATSNTSIKIKLKGSDGVVRSATIALT